MGLHSLSFCLFADLVHGPPPQVAKKGLFPRCFSIRFSSPGARSMLIFFLTFLVFWLCFPFILPFWTLTSFYFGNMAFHFLFFWTFRPLFSFSLMFWVFIAFYFGLWAFIALYFGLLGFHFLLFWPFGPISFYLGLHFFFFGLLHLHFFFFRLLRLHFLSFMSLGPSFPFILGFSRLYIFLFPRFRPS